MGFRRFAGFLFVLAVAAAAYGAYAPQIVERWSPAAGIYAWRLHNLLPAAVVDRQAGAPLAASAMASPLPSTPAVPVVVATASRRDFPGRVDAIGTVQPIATVSLRTRVDAAIDQVLVADVATVKAGDILFKLDADAKLKGAQAQLAKDQAQEDQTKRDVAIYTDLEAR